MVAQGEQVETHLIYELVLSLQKEVKGVRDDCADLGKRLGTLTEFMVRTTTLEQDRNLPAKIEAQDRRIGELERALTAAKAFGWFASILSTILGVWQIIKALSGH
jgi:hypothetical protein